MEVLTGNGSKHALGGDQIPEMPQRAAVLMVGLGGLPHAARADAGAPAVRAAGGGNPRLGGAVPLAADARRLEPPDPSRHDSHHQPANSDACWRAAAPCAASPAPAVLMHPRAPGPGHPPGLPSRALRVKYPFQLYRAVLDDTGGCTCPDVPGVVLFGIRGVCEGLAALGRPDAPMQVWHADGSPAMFLQSYGRMLDTAAP